MDNTPATPMGKIDTELRVATVLQRKKRGKGFKKAKKTRLYMGGGAISSGSDRVPLSVLIIHGSVLTTKQPQKSRPGIVRRGLGYNVLTGFRWARGASPFRGKNREAGRQAMRDEEHAMIAARHKSIGFLKAGWAACLRQLGHAVSQRNVKHKDDMGEARRSQSASGYILEVANRIGFRRGKKGWNDQNYNKALIRHGRGPLQEAVNHEARTKLEYYFNREIRKRLPMFFR